MTEKEKAAAGMLYDANNDPTLLAEMAASGEKCFALNSLPPSKAAERKAAIRALLGRTGDNFEIRSPFYCDYGYNIEIGENFFMNVNCVILDGEEVPFLESGLSVEECVGMQFRLYATFLYEEFSPDEVPTLTLGGIVKDGFSGSRYDTFDPHFPLLYSNHDFVFSEGCYETIWATHSALVPVDGDLLQTVRALSKADLLLTSEHGAESFYVVESGGDWVVTFPRVDGTLYDLALYMWIASGILGVIYLVLILQLITATIREKKSEIALMRALGLTKGQVFAAYFKAVCLFTLPSVLLAWLLMPAVVGVMNLIFAVEFMGYLVYPVFVTFLPFVYIGAFGIAAALLGFLAAVLLLARIPLAAAMRKEV